ncbi:MAG: hypothetical protein ACFFCV_04575 [Promethearchaeota archaeon]
MTPVMIWDPFERFLRAMAITILFMIAIQYILRGRKRGNINEKILMIGFSCFFIGFACNSFFTYIRDFVIPGNYINYVFYGEFDNLNSLYYILSKLTYSSDSLFFVFFILAFETSIKRTNYILTIILVIVTILMMLLPYDLSRLIHHTIYYGLKLSLTIIILFLLTKWSRLEFKAIASFILLGYFIMMVAETITSQDVKGLNVIPLILSPILLILGSFISILPLFVDPKHFTSATIIWKVNGTISIIISFISGVFFMIYFGPTHLNSLVLIIIFITLLYIFSLTMKIVKIESESHDKSTEPDILEIFTKPQKVTEEEVSISKEKKICLVCKNKITRSNYICPDCNAFYCFNCKVALSNLENACWVCNTPFDESKPSKPYKLEKEEEQVVIEEKSLKKGENNKDN